MRIKKLIYNWFVVNEREKVPPFSLLQKNHVSHIKTVKPKNYGKVILRMMHSLMKWIRKYAIEEGCWKEDKSKFDIEDICILWEKVGKK